MKGDPRLISALNQNLANEFTAVQQYITHAAIVRNWGYNGLAKYIQKRADEERQHSQQVIDRILFLEGKPIVTKLNAIYTAYEIPMQFNYDHAAELIAIAGYNDAIRLAVEVGDNSTRSYLEEILNDEIAHINGIENYQTQINQMTLQTWLVTQVKK
jgi:bacterioferritin